MGSARVASPSQQMPTSGSPWPRTQPGLAWVLSAVLVALALSACGSSSNRATRAAAAPSRASSNAVLRVGSDLTYPPYDYQRGGTPAGFDPELMRELAARLHQRVVFQDTRFEQLIPSLNSGQFGVIASALYITAKRATQVDYIPYLETGNSILVRADTPATAVGVSYLCGKTVGVIAGGAVVQSLQSEAKRTCNGAKPIQVHEFPTDPEATQALLSQQVDAQVTDAAVAKAALDKLAGKIKIASAELLYPIAVGLAVKKGDNALAQQLKRGLEKLRASGQYQALLGRYNLRPPDMAQVAKILGS